jgi:hypothetical protein
MLTELAIHHITPTRFNWLQLSSIKPIQWPIFHQEIWRAETACGHTETIVTLSVSVTVRVCEITTVDEFLRVQD